MPLRVQLPSDLEAAQVISLQQLLLPFVSSHPRETGQLSHSGPDGI